MQIALPVSSDLQSVLLHAPIGVLIIDARGQIVWVNETLAGNFGYRREALAGAPLETLLPERFRTGHMHHLQGYIAAPSSRMMGSGRDLTGLHSSGREFPVEIALCSVNGGLSPLFMAIVTDISGRKRAEEALQRTNAQLEEFTYVASHDLRSPLRGIADLISWIREDLGEETLPPDVQHNFDRVALRIRRAEQMIDDLLIYARAGNRETVIDTVDPVRLIEDAIALAEVPDTFTVETDIVGSPIECPRAPLAASLRNLVSNAVKHHGKDNGRIRIGLSEVGRFWVIHVEDDGKGIAEGCDERIFKLFHRASPDTAGDGVGLAVTRRMINAHGGMITVVPPSRLGGACFEIHWPRIQLKDDSFA